MTLKTADTPKVVVVHTDATTIERPKGALGLRRRHYSVTSLVPGLAVEVEGTKNDKNQFVATTVKFSKASLQTADAIQAGLTPTKQAVASNKEATETNQQAIQKNAQQIGVNQEDIADTNERFNDLSDYEVKKDAKVYFTPGSEEISDQGKAILVQLAAIAKPQNGYIVQVKGYADSTSNVTMNQRLSLDRSRSCHVIAYREQSGGIPVFDIVAPGAMGTSSPAASNETAHRRAEKPSGGGKSSAQQKPKRTITLIDV